MIDFPEFINLSIPALTNAGHLRFVNLKRRELFKNCPKSMNISQMKFHFYWDGYIRHLVNLRADHSHSAIQSFTGNKGLWSESNKMLFLVIHHCTIPWSIPGPGRTLPPSLHSNKSATNQWNVLYLLQFLLLWKKQCHTPRLHVSIPRLDVPRVHL